jgi:reverse gyrase
MDIQHLVDRLEDLIDEGRHMPFSKYTMIDEERALEIIDQMRISVPEEIEKAARILEQREKVMAQAHEEAARVVQQARQRGESLLDQEISVQAAQNRAANIIEQARQEAEAIVADADNYIMGELSRLEQQLIKTLTVVRNGIQEVNKSRGPHMSQMPAQAPQAAASEIQFAPPQPQPQHAEVESRPRRGDKG